jgi:hypothetical protein
MAHYGLDNSHSLAHVAVRRFNFDIHSQVLFMLERKEKFIHADALQMC